MKRLLNKIGALLFLITFCFSGLLLAGCNTPLQQPLVSPTTEPRNVEIILTEMAAEQPAVAKNPEVPAEKPATGEEPVDPLKTLRVCLGYEPESLFVYKNSSQAAWSILEGIYDGPFDIVNNEIFPVMFDSVETVSETVAISEGDLVMNSRGEPQLLKTAGVAEPQTCENNGDACLLPPEIVDNGQMIQTKITFRLKNGLKWSDGQPLTAQDSVYSWQLAGDPTLKNVKYFVNLTKTYEAPDDHTIIWTGIPGFVPQRISDVFWLPLPKHTMGGLSAEKLSEDESVNRRPIGWGAYQISNWEKGKEIVLTRNPYYLPAVPDQSPFFDQIIFRFYGEAGDNSLAVLRDGACDVIDTSVDLLPELEPILEDVRDQKLAVYIRPQPVWEQLTLNLSPVDENESNLFGEKASRQALAACLDRRMIIREVLYGQSEIPIDLFPSAEQQAAITDTTGTGAETNSGAQQLDMIGWKDEDQNPATPRVAKNVPGIPDGTPLSFALITSDSPYRLKTARLVQNQLGQCGVEITIKTVPFKEIYVGGPDSEIFGRKYQAALLAWGTGAQNPCRLLVSSQIPSADNHWLGTNVSGYESQMFDRACTAAQAVSPTDETAKREKHLEIQSIYQKDLPIIPLYFYPSIAASSRFVCGINNTVGSRSLLWNIERWSKSADACAISQWRDIYTEN